MEEGFVGGDEVNWAVGALRGPLVSGNGSVDGAAQQLGFDCALNYQHTQLPSGAGRLGMEVQRGTGQRQDEAQEDIASPEVHRAVAALLARCSQDRWEGQGEGQLGRVRETPGIPGTQPLLIRALLNGLT
jgi:hypothetical protein